MNVSVVIPCLDEEASLGKALESLADGFVRTEGEILVVDGGSRDRSREVAASFAARGWPLRVLDNPGRLQGHALNIGLAAARAPFIVRADAHSVYPPGYVRRCLALLLDKGADNAGGVMWPVGATPFQRAVACAMRHPAGVGDARYHLGNYSGWYDGVYLGAFRREVFDRVGPYDPEVHPNEDAELNMRLIGAGFRIWLEGSLRVIYTPRATFRGLVRQYFLYGRGRRLTARKHGRLTSWRQAAPVALLSGLAASLPAALVFPPALLLPAAYLAGLACAAFFVPCARSGALPSPEGDPPDPPLSGVERALLVPVFAAMHLAWASGFLFGKPPLRDRA